MFDRDFDEYLMEKADAMRTANDMEVGDEWKERVNDGAYWYGEVVHICQCYIPPVNQGAITVIYIRQASGNVITRSFWAQDVVEDNYNGKSVRLSAETFSSGASIQSTFEVDSNTDDL